MSQVSDYNIANASGASVRSDLNAVLDAIKTLNSGGTDPANTEAFMLYVDTADSNNLKIRNAANDGFITVGSVNSANLGLLPRAGGTMTGQFLADDSAGAGAPAISFDGDADTGMFRVGANELGFATSGSKKLQIDTDGLTIIAASSTSRTLSFQEASNNGTNTISLKSPDSLGGDVTFTLPGADGTNGQMIQTNGSGALSFTTVNGVPSGSVFCMAVATVPSGYLECNGAAVSRTTYSVLFGVIGTAYGTGNGSSTFNLPDLRGEFVRGFDNGRGADSGRSIASSQSALNASHTHSISASGTTSTTSLTGTATKISESFTQGNTSGVFSRGTNQTSGLTPSNVDSSPSGTLTIDASHNHSVDVSGTSGSQGGTESRPRNVAMMYVIKY